MNRRRFCAWLACLLPAGLLALFIRPSPANEWIAFANGDGDSGVIEFPGPITGLKVDHRSQRLHVVSGGRVFVVDRMDLEA